MSTVRCRHLLVKHAGSRRPASWKEPNITRSKEEAIQILQQHAEAIAQGRVAFDDLASRESGSFFRTVSCEVPPRLSPQDACLRVVRLCCGVRCCD